MSAIACSGRELCDAGRSPRHIEHSIRRIQDYTNGRRDAFMNRSRNQDGVIRRVGVIGETTKALSASSFRVTTTGLREMLGGDIPSHYLP